MRADPSPGGDGGRRGPGHEGHSGREKAGGKYRAQADPQRRDHRVEHARSGVRPHALGGYRVEVDRAGNRQGRGEERGDLTSPGRGDPGSPDRRRTVGDVESPWDGVCWGSPATRAGGKSPMSQVEPARYEIKVRGRLSDALRATFDGFDVAEVPVETILCGIVADQAALHGLLNQIQLYGLELVEVRRSRDRPDVERG